ncbi:DUF6115 domain-containing protein [Planococcus sp. CPCC 101016]|uniref:DUF6115 domain-containing protein n=1 Tax=Planococcus sp. CPCC 101016 TaxID=2599617 RepID=UPI0021BDED37|nr:hypothetical protein [Planococcus sp. CPCC 101016]
MTMEWLLIAGIILLMLMNIKLMLSVKKQQIDEEEPAEIHESMAEFVAQLEKENDELYDKLTAYIKDNELQLAERIERLEENLASDFEEAPQLASIETEKVLQLSKQGFSSKQIAKVLQVDYGKVELVVNMNNKQQGNFKEDEVL